MTDIRKETDSLGEVDVAADKLWGAQTQRSLECESFTLRLRATKAVLCPRPTAAISFCIVVRPWWICAWGPFPDFARGNAERSG